MKVQNINVLLEVKRSEKVNGKWKSYGLRYGASALLEDGEVVETAIPALDAALRDIISEAPGFKFKGGKLLVVKY